MDFTKFLFERNVTKDFLSKKIYNKILFESDNFIVIPSLGSLVKGWVLVVPKQYALCMGQLEPSLLLELEHLSQNVTLILEKEFGKVVIFEHGAALPDKLVGCGVDYAHLHIVPISINLIDELEGKLKIEYDWHTISGLDFASIYSKQDLPYLYVQDMDNQRFVSTSQDIPSQLFRKVIADYLSIPNEYDWKFFHQLNTIQDTINILSKYPQRFPENTYAYGRRNE